MRQSVASTEPVQYYFTLAQQPGAVQVQGQQQGQQVAAPATALQPGQIIIAQPQQGQVTHTHTQTDRQTNIINLSLPVYTLNNNLDRIRKKKNIVTFAQGFGKDYTNWLF